MTSAYYRLVKPGVLYGNVLTAAAGFLLASRGSVDIWLFIATIAGTTLVIASACVLNNVLDQDIDSKMERTKKRPLIAGEVKGSHAVMFSAALGITGVGILAAWVSWLVVIIGVVGFIVYVVLYGMSSKRLSIHGTLVGSVSGAAPILAGYVAANGWLDLGAAIVFMILFLWQMPEFYAIAIYRRKEYKAAGVPVISVVKGNDHTKFQILMYIIAFVAATMTLGALGYASNTYMLIMAALGAYWVWIGVKGQGVKDDNAWAKNAFRYSLIVLLAFSFLISVDAWLP